MSGKDDEICRIGNRQQEARRIGHHGADEEMGQRIDARLLRRREHRWRHHHRSGVIRQDRRHRDGDEIDQREEPRRRSPRRPHGMKGEPVEETLAPRHFRQQHHAGEEEIDIAAFRDGTPRACRRHPAAGDQHRRARDRPDRFRPAQRTQHDAGCGEHGDHPDHGRGGEHRQDDVECPGRSRQVKLAKKFPASACGKGGILVPPFPSTAPLKRVYLSRSMTARRFCGSRTPGPVGTSGSWKLLPWMATPAPSRPWRTISSFTLSARRTERP